MSTSRPLPNIDHPVTGGFWRAANEHRLAMQQCDDCQHRRWPPAPICPQCLSAGGTWAALSGQGTIWSLATYHRAFAAGLSEEVPYTVILVQLAEGPRMISRLSGNPADANIGDAVTADFEPVAEGVTLVNFRLA